jgi:hypothetical protein
MPGEHASKVPSFFALILFSLFLVWFAAGRRSIGNLWDDLRGRNPPYWLFEVFAESIG